MVGKANRGLLADGDGTDGGGFERPPETGGEELGHCLVEVEQDPGAEQTGYQSCKDERIGQRVYLHEPVTTTAVKGGGEHERDCSKRAILEEISEHAAALVRDRHA